MTVPAHTQEFINKLFKKTLVADATDVVDNVKKSWHSGRKIIQDDGRHRLSMLSSDDRIAELIEEAATFMSGFHETVPFDLVVTPLATGSKEYIEWVKL